MQDSLKTENTPALHCREYNVSHPTESSFLAKFKATQNKLGQKRHHHSVYIICIYICKYIYIYYINVCRNCLYKYIYISGRYMYIYISRSIYQEESQLKYSAYQLVLLATSYTIFLYNMGRKFIIFWNYVCKWKMWCQINDNFKQLYCGCGYGPFTNNKGMYTNLLKNYIII